MNETPPPAGNAILEQVQRYVPLLTGLVCLAALLLVPLKIIGYGFLPPDDVLRHAAKIISGKDWTQVLVMREGITIDHNAGWHAILGLVHQATGANAEGLATFSIAFLCALFLIVPFAFLRRPEAWLVALVAACTAWPPLILRLAQGRPFLLMMTCVSAILFLWVKEGARKRPAVLVASTLLVALASWVHGGWYTYWLPAAALIAALRFKDGFSLLGCWAVGSFLGGLLTGHPFHFLQEQLEIPLAAFGNHSLHRMLVTEFFPSGGYYEVVALVPLALLARAAAGLWTKDVWRNPALLLAVIGWVLGLQIQRFWLDWGLPALVVWLGMEAKDHFDRFLPREALARLVVACIASAAFYFGCTADLNSRWTDNLTKTHLDANDPEQAAWMPGDGGIVYADSMVVFYDMFFRHPTAPWRYVLGFEPAFMPEDDLAVYRLIQWNSFAPEAYAGWVAKMRPEDRLIVRRRPGAKPAIEGLDWKYLATDTWVGRRP